MTQSAINVHHAMRAYHQFICHDDAKMPVNAHGEPISAQDSTQWLTYEQAVATGRPIGFVFTSDDPFVFIDLDDCVGPGGEISTLASSVLSWFPGAAVEVSRSGAGLHIFCSGAASIIGQHKTKSKAWSGLEIYTQGRFAALTGTGLRGDAVWDAAGVLPSFVQAYGLTATHDVAAVTATTVRPEYTGPSDDRALIAMMLDSIGSANQIFDTAHVRDLWCGDLARLSAAYPDGGGRPYDASAADMALMNHLAFWTGCDAVRMVRLFCMSAIYRPDQYEGKGAYRIKRLLDRSIGSCKTVYSVGTKPVPGAGPAADAMSWADLWRREFQPVRFLVPDMVPEGTTLLSAKPKVGKSMLAINLACATIAGTSFMGHRAAQGGVLHLGLEDTGRRLQGRYAAVMGRLGIDPALDWPLRLMTADVGVNSDNVLNHLHSHMQLFPDTRLIIIDTLAQIKPARGNGETIYDHDRRSLDPVTTWCHQHPGLSVMLVDHNRKDATSGDPFDDIAGSTGKTAAVDVVTVLRENRIDAGTEVTISSRGREIEEIQITAKLADGLWVNLGDAEGVEKSRITKAIIDLLKISTVSMLGRDIIDEIGCSKGWFYKIMKVMIAEGAVERDGRKYRLSPFYDINKT